jgi:hypothetical protein
MHDDPHFNRYGCVCHCPSCVDTETGHCTCIECNCLDHTHPVLP